MSTFDSMPFFRSSVGFDRMVQMLEAFDDKSSPYPPYNILKVGEEAYRITMAVAGFREEDLKIVTHEGMLSVTGVARSEEEGVIYIHRGIARRAFERRFQLADFIRVTGAQMGDGLLHIELVREVPENLKPRTVSIKHQNPLPKRIDHAPVPGL